MAEIEELYEYLIFIKPTEVSTEDEVVKKIEPWDIRSCLICEKTWKIFKDFSFDVVQLKAHFSSLPEEERVPILKAGIAYLITYARCNSTGPNLDKDAEDFLNGDFLHKQAVSNMLTVNNEDINVNCKFPILLLASKMIFEHCVVNNAINNWWYWRSILIHQESLDELSPTLLSDADRLYKQLQGNVTYKSSIKAALDIEVAQMYLLFRQVTKAKEHIVSASEILGVQYNLVGLLGKRTKHQQKDIAQLSLKVTVEETVDDDTIDSIRIEDEHLPKNIPLNDDTLLNNVEFAGEIENHLNLSATRQKLLITIVQEMLIAKPPDELVPEEIQPFLDLILRQKNSYAVRVVALLLRSKFESKSKRTVERSLAQCEEVISSFGHENPHYLYKVADIFSTGFPPIWKVETQYADLLLNIGLIKNALDVYLKIKLWEEVIVCYTVLKMKHKSADVIQGLMKEKPTVKLWCLLGDANDDITCYEKAWELSKRRSHRAQRHWGQFLFVRKKYEECIPHFEKSVSINPLQAKIWFRLGFAALQIENWQTAATAYRRYTTLEPDSFEAWNNLAQAYIKIGNKRNAHQAILEALKSNFDNWKVWENLLVVSCDISNFSDVIRAYHRCLDLKEKYLNVEVLNVLVYNVCNDVNDCEGQPSQRFLQKTRELLGRVTAIHPGEGYVWELYSSLAPVTLLRAQRLQRAFRGYTQGSWDKNPATCQQVLYVCIKLADIVLDNEFDPKDTTTNSVKLNLNTAVAAIKKHDWEQTRDLLQQVSTLLEKVSNKIKSAPTTTEVAAS